MDLDLRFIENCRIKLAKEFDVPPDDINLFALCRCVERGIQRQVVLNEESCSVSPVTDEEKEIVWSDTGIKILYKIFDEEYPFGDFINNLKNINESNK